MTVTCRNCSSRVTIPDELVQLGGFLVQCTGCETPVAIDPEEIAQAEGFELSLSAAAEVLGSPARSGARDGSVPAETLSSIIDELQEAPAAYSGTISSVPSGAAHGEASLHGRPAPEATIRMAVEVLPDLNYDSLSVETPVLAASAAPVEATVQPGEMDPAVRPGVVLAAGGAAAATMRLDAMSLPPSLVDPLRPARQRFRIRNQDGTESLRNSLELIRLIRDGRLSRAHEIAPEGSETWRRAETMQEIERYFELREQAVKASSVPMRSSPSCVNHRTSVSAWRCGSCSEHFCADCVKIQRIGGTRTVPCPFCNQLCQPVETLKSRIFDWPELPRLLRFPLVGWGPIYWVAYAIQSWMAPFAGFLGGPILVFFLLVYGILVVRESAAGRSELPTWPSLSVWSSLASRAAPAFVAILLALAPLALAIGFSLPASKADVASADGAALATARSQASLPVQAAPHESRSPSAALRATRARLLGSAAGSASTLARLRDAGAGGAFLVAAALLLAAVYLPMAFLGLCVRERPFTALDPRRVAHAIRTVPGEYGRVVALFLILVIAGTILVQPFGSMPVLGGAGIVMIGTYFLFIQLHALGRMAKQCEQRLDWRLPPASGKGARP